MLIVIKGLINVHLLVNELCEYQNARLNDKIIFHVCPDMANVFTYLNYVFTFH
jgi:hypothetical protein